MRSGTMTFRTITATIVMALALGARPVAGQGAQPGVTTIRCIQRELGHLGAPPHDQPSLVMMRRD